MNAVYTFWETTERTINGGFGSSKELARMMALSLEYSKKQFDKVILSTNKGGKELLVDKYGLEYDEIIYLPEELDEKLDGDLWGFAKIQTYKMMCDRGEAFIHIDCDAIIWKDLPQRLFDAPLFFQNKEVLRDFHGYDVSIALAEKSAVHPNFMTEFRADCAFNCGIVGVNKDGFSLIQEWYNVVKEFIFTPENKSWWNEQTDKHSKNHLFEQFFVSCLIKKYGWVDKCQVLLEDFDLKDYQNDPQTWITHLWGETKRNPITIRKIAQRLYREYPEYRRIENNQPTHKEIFTKIYRENVWHEGSGGGSTPKQTEDYRKFLIEFMEKNKIKTVVDLACGDWQINSLIDWTGKKIIGVDVVPSIMKHNQEFYASENVKFVVADIQDYEIPKCDLLIIKDVFIHWKNDEILKFLKKNIPAKYILITEDNRVGGVNKDNDRTGGYRDVDITKPPFNLNAELVFKTDFPHKSTYLVNNSI